MKNFLLKFKFIVVLLMIILGVLFFSLMLNVIIHIYTENYIYKYPADVISGKFQAVMILGSSINPDGSLATMLKDRTDTAIDLYKEGKVGKILISADNGTVEYNEVIPTKRYVLSAGVPPEDIFLDFAGFDTYDSMYRAKTIFNIDSLLVSTQEFHLPRSLMIAHFMGIDAYGIVADKHNYPNLNYNMIREFFANIKASYRLITHSHSHHSGETIPITGTGNAVNF